MLESVLVSVTHNSQRFWIKRLSCILIISCSIISRIFSGSDIHVPKKRELEHDKWWLICWKFLYNHRLSAEWLCFCLFMGCLHYTFNGSSSSNLDRQLLIKTHILNFHEIISSHGMVLKTLPSEYYANNSNDVNVTSIHMKEDINASLYSEQALCENSICGHNSWLLKLVLMQYCHTFEMHRHQRGPCLA